VLTGTPFLIGLKVAKLQSCKAGVPQVSLVLRDLGVKQRLTCCLPSFQIRLMAVPDTPFSQTVKRCIAS